MSKPGVPFDITESWALHPERLSGPPVLRAVRFTEPRFKSVAGHFDACKFVLSKGLIPEGCAVFLIDECCSVRLDRIVQDVPLRNVVAVCSHEETDYGNFVERSPASVCAVRMTRSEQCDHLGADLTGSRVEAG